MKRELPILVSVLLIGLVIGMSINASAQESIIPSWIKNTAKFWIEGKISDQEFLQAIKFLIENRILIVSQTETKQVEQKSSPELISKEGKAVVEKVSTSNEGISGSFGIRDSKGNYFTNDGWLYLTIINSEGVKVYNNRLHFFSGDFKKSTDSVGRQAYFVTWSIPFSQITPSTSSEGTIFVEFGQGSQGNPSNKVAEYKIDILPFKGEMTARGSSYAQTATKINKIGDAGPFRINVIIAGPYLEEKFGIAEEYFRIDLEITNQRETELTFAPQGLSVLTDENIAYSVDYGGTLDTYMQIPGNSKKVGYYLFEKIPADKKNLDLVFSVLIYEDIFDTSNYTHDFKLSFKLN